MKRLLFLLLLLPSLLVAQNQASKIIAFDWFAGAAVDVSKPSIVASSNAPLPSSSGTYTATFTFSENVTGFTVGDITISGAVLGTLVGSGSSYNVTVTPTFTQDVTISVAAGVCADLSGNTNTASNNLTVRTTFQVGSIHTDNFNGGTLTPYAQTGTAFSVVSGDARFTTSTGGFNEYLLLNTPNVVSAHATHCLEKWVAQVLFTCPTGTPFGFGIGVRSTNGPEQFDNIIRLAFDAAQEAKQGTVYYYTSQNHGAPAQTVATMGATFTLVTGTDYIFEVERDKNVFTAKLKSADGVTTHKTYTSFTCPITASGVRAHNTGKFGVWAFGGTALIIKNYAVTTKAQKNVAILGAGDSNMHGLYAQTNAGRYMEQVASNLSRSLEIVAGINAEIPDIPLTSIIALAPVKIFVNIGSNDEANGVADATWQTRFNTMFSTLSAAGYNSSNVVIGLPVARNGQDMAAIKTFLDANYSSYTRVDLYTTTKQAGNTSLQAAYNSGDNIHMSAAGNTACVAPTQAGLPDGSNDGTFMLHNVIDEDGFAIPIPYETEELIEIETPY